MPKLFAGLFLNSSSILSFDLFVCAEFAGLFLVLLEYTPLRLICTCQFDGCGA